MDKCKAIAIFLAACAFSYEAAAVDLPKNSVPCADTTKPLLFDTYGLSIPKIEGLVCTYSDKVLPLTTWRTDHFEAGFLNTNTYSDGGKQTGKSFYKMYASLYSGVLNPETTMRGKKEFNALQEYTRKNNDQYGVMTGNGQVVFYSHRDYADATGNMRPMNGNVFIMKESDIHIDKPVLYLNASCQCTLQEMFDYLILPAIHTDTKLPNKG